MNDTVPINLLKEVENRFKDSKVEHCAYIDANNNKLLGKETTCYLPFYVCPDHNITIDKALSTDTILTHNHPGSPSISPQDVIAGILNGASEVRCIGKNGVVQAVRFKKLSKEDRIKIGNILKCKINFPLYMIILGFGVLIPIIKLSGIDNFLLHYMGMSGFFGSCFVLLIICALYMIIVLIYITRIYKPGFKMFITNNYPKQIFFGECKIGQRLEIPDE